MGVLQKVRPAIIYDAAFISTVEWLHTTIKSCEPRPGAPISAATRGRIAATIEILIELLDLTDPDSEEVPVFPGHPNYQPPAEAWVLHQHGMASGLDVDREEEELEDDDTDREVDLGGQSYE